MEAIEKSGLGKGWKDDNVGHGPAYCFTDPDGHQIEIYYETEWYQPSAEMKPALKNQASRYSDRGVGVRRLDHIALLAVRCAIQSSVHDGNAWRARYRADHI